MLLVVVTFFLSLMDPFPRTIILQPVSCSSCLVVIPRGPKIRPTKLNWKEEKNVSEIRSPWRCSNLYVRHTEKKYYVYFQATFLLMTLLSKGKKVENGTTRRKTSWKCEQFINAKKTPRIFRLVIKTQYITM